MKGTMLVGKNHDCPFCQCLPQLGQGSVKAIDIEINTGLDVPVQTDKVYFPGQEHLRPSSG